MSRSHSAPTGFRHEALLYEGDGGFVDALVPFVEGALSAGEPLMVMVGGEKIDMLRAALGRDAKSVEFRDMTRVGRNPARIIPAWREFATANGGRERPLRGIGEHVWPERSPDELGECWRHEALLNVAFATAPALWLQCPYDRTQLAPEVIAAAHCNHPVVVRADGIRQPTGCPIDWPAAVLLDGPLPEPPAHHVRIPIVPGRLGGLRDTVARYARTHGCDEPSTADFVLAANELVANSLVHADAEPVLRLWHTGEAFVCEVRDRGVIAEPLAGRVPAPGDLEHGRGLWIVNQVCDLVQMRSGPSGTQVRIHMGLRGREPSAELRTDEPRIELLHAASA